MKANNLSPNLRLTVLYNDFVTVGPTWNFQHVISPFNRLYLIADGTATITMKNQLYTLNKGDLFLIPKFTSHSYSCENSMTHYYICFTDESWGGGSLFNSSLLRLQLKATEFDRMLIERFFSLSTDNGLPSINPKKYDNKEELLQRNRTCSASNYRKGLELNGILQQLYSRFITEDCLLTPEKLYSFEKISHAVFYIDEHLDSLITVTQLAQLSNLTVGHFSKVFKQVIGVPPIEYLLEKRIQRAQVLLLTSDLTISEIAVKVGVPGLTQFSRLFSRLIHCSPSQYRKEIH